jgi:hypothetical protein
MGQAHDFYYEPDDDDPLSTAVVHAVAQAHDEDVIEQRWIISEDINADALDGLFQQSNLDMTLKFEADTTTVTVVADDRGRPVVKVESHR